MEEDIVKYRSHCTLAARSIPWKISRARSTDENGSGPCIFGFSHASNTRVPGYRRKDYIEAEGTWADFSEKTFPFPVAIVSPSTFRSGAAREAIARSLAPRTSALVQRERFVEIPGWVLLSWRTRARGHEGEEGRSLGQSRVKWICWVDPLRLDNRKSTPNWLGYIPRMVLRSPSIVARRVVRFVETLSHPTVEFSRRTVLFASSISSVPIPEREIAGSFYGLYFASSWSWQISTDNRLNAQPAVVRYTDSFFFLSMFTSQLY